LHQPVTEAILNSWAKSLKKLPSIVSNSKAEKKNAKKKHKTHTPKTWKNTAQKRKKWVQLAVVFQPNELRKCLVIIPVMAYSIGFSLLSRHKSTLTISL